MSDGNSPEDYLNEAKKTLEEIRQQKADIQRLMDESKAVRKHIDSEALLAHNAKLACEEHSTEVARIKGTVEAESQSLATIKQQAAEAAAAINQSKASSDEDRKAVGDCRRNTEEKSANTVESIKNLEKECEAAVARLKESDERNHELEKQLKQFQEKMDGVARRAEELLPGFASAGLAHSFKEQRSRFGWPQKLWIGVFLGCIVLLVGVAIPSFYSAVKGAEPGDWDQFIRSILMRLPITLPLIWLAIYSGRNYMLAARLEEDYAFKEAVSRAFEGYKREMSAIAENPSTNPSPLITLCNNILSVIGERPGRLYEARQSSHSIQEEINDRLNNASNLANRGASN